MYLNNVGIFVKDLEGARQFFTDYFGAKVFKEYNEPENNYYSYIMEFDEGGAKLELMTKPEIVDEPKNKDRSGYAHICIKVPSIEKLDEINQKFKDAGYTILYEPATVGGAEIRAITFEDNVIEVNGSH